MDKVTTLSLKRMKEKGEKIVALTAYDFPTARILDEAEVDVILIGDSAANVIYGYSNTLPLSMEEILFLTKAVARGVKRALIVGDMPFLSYQVSLEEAIRNAGRFLKAGAEAVKIEGGEPVLATVKKLVSIGIPVMGHLGLTPQSIHQFGGYGVRGRTANEREKILEDAKRLESAGCFSIVLEKIPQDLAKEITESLRIPTIGIGAGPHCDGQILVLHDLIGLFEEFKPKFVKRYTEIGRIIRDAVEKYKEEVKKGLFPGKEHSFK